MSLYKFPKDLLIKLLFTIKESAKKECDDKLQKLKEDISNISYPRIYIVLLKIV